MAAPGMLSPLCSPLATPLTKHLNAQYRRLSQVSHAPLEFPECGSMTTGAGEVSRGSMEANMQRHKSQRGRLSFTSSSIHWATSWILSPQAVCSGGTKKDMGVKSAIEFYNPVLSAFFNRTIFKPLSPAANQLRAQAPSEPTCPSIPRQASI